jgi:hypothetical protein
MIELVNYLFWQWAILYITRPSVKAKPKSIKK